MEFQAYPASPKEGKPASFQALWRAHGLLHKTDNIVIPLTLLVASVGMAIYQHVANKDTGDTTIRNFLVLIFLSMVPVAVLEKKLMACTDPVGTISRFSSKVLLMHASFLVIRCVSGLLYDYNTPLFHYRNRAGLIVACLLLPRLFGIRFSRACLWEHRDVALLTGVAISASIGTEVVDAYVSGSFGQGWLPTPWLRSMMAAHIITSSSDYIEILAFVPAMWMVCREDKSIKEPCVADAQRRSLALFVFILTFYTLEDLHNAFLIGMDDPFAAAGHIAHFLLLLDFSAYILSHLYDPTKYEKIMNKLWNLVSDSAAV